VPGPETRAFYEELQRDEREGEPEATSYFESPTQETFAPNNLLLPPTHLVGRIPSSKFLGAAASGWAHPEAAAPRNFELGILPTRWVGGRSRLLGANVS